MNTSTKDDLNFEDNVSRRLLQKPTVTDPASFRSWKSQALPEDARQSEKVRPVARKRSSVYSFWHSRDFRLLLAFLVTGAVVAAVYFSMKGS